MFLTGGALAKEVKLTVKIKDIKKTTSSQMKVSANYKDYVFSGKAKESKKNGKSNVYIEWHTATKQKQKFKLGKKVESSVEVHPKYGLEKGDEVILKGKIGIKDLVSETAKQADNSQENSEIEGEEIFNAESSDGSTNFSSGSGSGSTATAAKVEPDVNLKTSETEEGCSVRIDTGAKLAYIQKKSVEGGKVTSACKDSAEFYNLVKDYAGCKNFVNYSSKEVFKQYRYYYVRDGKKMVLDTCYKDNSTRMQIREEYNSCNMVHQEDYSLDAMKLYYIGDGNKRIYLTDCKANQDKQYKHAMTYVGCTAKQTGNLVTPYHRKYISKDGSNVYLSECVPVPETNQVQEEICSTRFQHNTGSSFYRKNYYYMRGSEKIYLSKCVVSEESVIHQQETTGCDKKNDDITKSYTSYYRTYVEDKHEGNAKVEVSGCKASSTATPYSKIGTKWERKSSAVQMIHINNLNHGIYLGADWKVQKVSKDSVHEVFARDFDTETADIKSLCWNRGISSVWQTSGGQTIDASVSDETPNYVASYTTRAAPQGLTAYTAMMRTENRPKTDYYASCHTPKCTVSLLHQHPKYRRGDNSEYIDTNTILDLKYVCGSGSLLTY